MAGSDPRFDPALFRENIKFAMHMGLPTDTAKRATFVWRPNRTFAGSTDIGGKPLDWSQTPSANDDPDPFQCDYAVEFGGASDRATPAGESIEDVKATITILDSDWDDVLDNGSGRRPDQVTFDGSSYDIEYVKAIGLFEVTVYQLELTSLDEH